MNFVMSVPTADPLAVGTHLRFGVIYRHPCLKRRIISRVRLE